MPIMRVNDINLYYEISGQGQSLLFIHGLGSSSRDWEMQTPFFSRNYRVVTFDVRGHGRSDKPAGPYRIEMFAADAAALLSVLDIAPAHVVGISMGGMIALQLAVDAPHLVRSLVIVNAEPEIVVRTFREHLQVWMRFALVRLAGMRKVGEVLAKRLFIKAEQEDLRRAFIERWAENDRRAYLESMRAILRWSVADRLGEIRCPALIIAADQDYTPVARKEAYATRISQAEVVVFPDSRHATPVEWPQKFNEVVAAFLAKHGKETKGKIL